MVLFNMRSHSHSDRLHLALARAAAAKLRQQPDLFTKVRRQLTRWRANLDGTQAGTRPYLERWEALAALGPEAMISQVLETSEQATAMRQTAPFAGVLTSQERMAIIRALRAGNEPRGA
ncbi:hypothetical protein [Reyranella sp.]|uniref:hypothetical protein n=1 Tax=Reyranella sp. TaxID=1929291 RepID=UPI003C7D15C1